MLKEKIWSKAFTALTISNSLNNLGTHMLTPTIPLYLVELGATESQVGLTATAFYVASIITRLLVGVVSRRIGKKPTVVAGVLLTAIVIALYGFIESIAAAALLRTAQGIGFGITTTLFTTLAADALPDSRRGEGVGYFSMAVVLAMVVAPALSLYLMETYSFHFMFYAAALFPLISIIGMRFFKAPTTVREDVEAYEKIPFWRSIYDPKLTFQSILLIMLGICRSADINFISLFAEARKLELLSVYFLIQTITSFCVRFVVGRIADRKGRNWVLIPGGSAALAALLVLSVTKSSGLLLLAGVFNGIAVGVLVPAMQIWMFNTVGQEQRGVASATYFNFYDIGVSLGAIALGFLVENAGYTVMFLCTAAAAVLYLVCYAIGGMERKEKPARSSLG